MKYSPKSARFRPKLKISLFPLTRPTEIFLLEICRYFFLPFFSLFRSKFTLLKIRYFRFVSPKDRYFLITEHIFVVQKKKSLPTYTSKIVGRVRGNKNISNCGLMYLNLKQKHARMSI